MTGAEGFGANYWPAHAGPAMWRDFRPGEIAADLGALAAAGVSYVRSFVLWPEFMPSPDEVDPTMLDRLERFMALVEAAGLRLHLTLLVGHMSGENRIPAWLRDPSRLFDDDGLLAGQERLVRAVVDRARRSPALEAYVLTNEMPNLTGGADRAAVSRWADRLVGAIRAADPGRPVSLGDGAGYVVGARTGFGPDLAQDVIAPHLYLSDTNEERLIAAFGLAVGIARAFGRKVWLEEFGAPHSVYGEDEVADWAGKVAREARLQGVTRLGWWCGFDFDPSLAAGPPYSHHPFELTFGMLRADRTPKPVARALREAMAEPLPDMPPAALLVPDAFFGETPFAPPTGDLLTRALRNAYAALRRLGFLPRPVLEHQLSRGSTPSPLFVPAARILRAGTWEVIEEVDGPVVLSYLHGAGGFQGAWIHRAAAFFGGSPHLRFGVPAEPPRQLLAGDLELDLPGAGDPFVGTPLLLDPTEAEVVGRDEQGRPIWVRVGRRDMLLYPVEALSNDPSPVEAFYRAALGLAASTT